MDGSIDDVPFQFGVNFLGSKCECSGVVRREVFWFLDRLVVYQKFADKFQMIVFSSSLSRGLFLTKPDPLWTSVLAGIQELYSWFIVHMSCKNACDGFSHLCWVLQHQEATRSKMAWRIFHGNAAVGPKRYTGRRKKNMQIKSIEKTSKSLKKDTRKRCKSAGVQQVSQYWFFLCVWAYSFAFTSEKLNLGIHQQTPWVFLLHMVVDVHGGFHIVGFYRCHLLRIEWGSLKFIGDRPVNRDLPGPPSLKVRLPPPEA